MIRDKTYNIESFEDFINLTMEALKVADDSRYLLFPLDVRDAYHEAYLEFYGEDGEGELYPSELIEAQWSENSDKAGLNGAQLSYKFAEIESSANKFHNYGGITNFKNLLKKAVILLKSAIGAIPAIGSALQELIDFVIERLEDLSQNP